MVTIKDTMVCRLSPFIALLLLVSTLVFEETAAFLKLGRELNLTKLKNLKRQKENTVETPAGMEDLERKRGFPEWNGEKEMQEYIRSVFENKNKRF